MIEENTPAIQACSSMIEKRFMLIGKDSQAAMDTSAIVEY